MRKLPALTVALALTITLAACGSDDSTSGSSKSPASSSAAASTPASSSGSAAPTVKATGAPAIETSGDQSALKGISISGGNTVKKSPKTVFTTPAPTKAKLGAALINQGKGEAVKPGKQIKVRIAQFDAKTGKEMSAGSWATAQKVTFDSEAFKGEMSDVYAVLKKAKVGADVAYYVPAKVAGTAQIWVMRVDGQQDAPKKADAAEVKKLKAAGDLPTVKFSKSKPTITIPKGKDAPNDLIVDVVKEGHGKAATAKSNVTAKYQGVRWEDGKVFDGTYDKKPDTADFGLDKVIPGWTQGLTGIKQGSTVVLSIPSDLAYGDNAAAQGAPAGPLVFVVELTKVK